MEIIQPNQFNSPIQVSETAPQITPPVIGNEKSPGFVSPEDLAKLQSQAFTGVEASQKQVSVMIDNKAGLEGLQADAQNAVEGRAKAVQDFASEISTSEFEAKKASGLEGTLRSEVYMESRELENLEWKIDGVEAVRQNAENEIKSAAEALERQIEKITREAKTENGGNAMEFRARLKELRKKKTTDLDAMGEILDKNVHDLGLARESINNGALEKDSGFFNTKEERLAALKPIVEEGDLADEGKNLTIKELKRVEAKYDEEENTIHADWDAENKRVADAKDEKTGAEQKKYEEIVARNTVIIEKSLADQKTLEGERDSIVTKLEEKKADLETAEKTVAANNSYAEYLKEELETVNGRLETDRVMLSTATERMGALSEKGAGAIEALKSLSEVIENRILAIEVDRAGLEGKIDQIFDAEVDVLNAEVDEKIAEATATYVAREAELFKEIAEGSFKVTIENGQPKAEGAATPVEAGRKIRRAMESIDERLDNAIDLKDEAITKLGTDLGNRRQEMEASKIEAFNLLQTEYQSAANKLEQARQTVSLLQETAQTAFGVAEQVPGAPAEQVVQTPESVQREKNVVKRFVGFFKNIFGGNK